MLYIDKKSLQYHLARIRRIKTWQLVFLLVILSLVSASLLRLNNLGMMERRDAVMAADAKNDRQAVKKALVDLQAYVSSHMNTSMGKGIYLEKQYERDREAALSAAADVSNPNAAVYQQASIECRSRWQGNVDSFRNDYVQCVTERLRTLGVASDPASALQLPKAENYHHNFLSPKWSADLAGFSVLLCLFVTSVIVIRVLTGIILRLLLKHRYKAM